MSFRNPILSGPTLVRAAIQSANFVTGVSGWQIMRNGNAEFNGATFRGQIIVTGANAILFYSPVAGAGNLVASFSPIAGTDPYGNVYPAGMRVGAPNNPGIVAGYSGSTGLIYFPGTVPNVALDAKLQLNIGGAGMAQRSFLTMGSAVDTTQNDSVALNAFASSQDGTQTAHITLTYTDPLGVNHSYVVVDPAGGATLVGTITGLHPGTYSRSSPAVAETWQNPAFGSNWTTGTFAGGVRSLHYRLDSEGRLFIVGTFHSTSNAPAATIFTLPSGYFDATDTQAIPVLVNNAGAMSINGLLISSTGAASLVTNLTTTNTDVWVDAIVRISV